MPNQQIPAIEADAGNDTPRFLALPAPPIKAKKATKAKKGKKGKSAIKRSQVKAAKSVNKLLKQKTIEKAKPQSIIPEKSTTPEKTKP